MHHQRREWNERFESPNGHTTKFPGGFGVADLDVNCRCAALPSRAAQRLDLNEFGDPVEIYEDVRKPHVEEVQRAWRKVFREQEAERLPRGATPALVAAARISAMPLEQLPDSRQRFAGDKMNDLVELKAFVGRSPSKDWDV